MNGHFPRGSSKTFLTTSTGGCGGSERLFIIHGTTLYPTNTGLLGTRISHHHTAVPSVICKTFLHYPLIEEIFGADIDCAVVAGKLRVLRCLYVFPRSILKRGVGKFSFLVWFPPCDLDEFARTPFFIHRRFESTFPSSTSLV